MKMEKLIANLARSVEQRFYGKYRGFVKKNEDPEKLGRLLVTVPSVLGDKVAVWAFPCVPYGGMPDQGFLFIPEIKAGVWIEFEEGDPEFPIWVGTFWSKPSGKSELPKPNQPDGKEKGEVQSPPSSKIIKTKKGHTIQLEDKDGDEMILLVEGKNKHVVTLDKDGIKITDGVNHHIITLNKDGIETKDGRNYHIITLDKDGIKAKDGMNNHEITLKRSGIEVKAQLSFSVTAGENTFKMDSRGISFEDYAGNKITMGAAGITMTDPAQNKISIGPAGITIKANSMINIEATGPGKIMISPAGVILGLGAGGPIATVGTCMVATLLGPQPIGPGPNLTSMA